MLALGTTIIQRLWRQLWSIKVEHFIWKVLRNSIPCNDALFLSKITPELSCPLCDGGDETPSHALLWACEFIKKVWKTSVLVIFYYRFKRMNVADCSN